MSIRFKFRSSVNFDTIEIDGNRDSISVRELRAKILRGISSQQQQGFDLVFSDAVTGLEYDGYDCHIPSGSSIIVKRIPGGTLPSAAPPAEPVKNLSIQHAIDLDPASARVDKFDDFGADLCPVPVSNIPFGKRTADEEMQRNKRISSDVLAQNASLPLELKCTLCSTFFKKAVMIPCCQHSFCEKCIQQELTEKGRCPKCLSSNCKVEDLLPNVVLDKAIRHFHESQMLDDCLENDMDKYVPDGESVIHGKAKETTYGTGVFRRTIESPQSSSGAREECNPVLMNANTANCALTMPLEDNDFQGENQPVFDRINVEDEADTNTNKKVVYRNGSGVGGGNFLVGGQRKGIRTCYICGCPDHLMRDCSMNPMLRNGAFHGGFPGYPPAYWSGPPYGPYPNMYYNSPGMMSFTATMVPASAYAIPFPTMTNCPPGPGGNMQMGVKGPPLRSEYFRLEHCKNGIKSNENLERRKFVDEEDDYHRHNGTGMSNEYELPYKEEPRLSHSGRKRRRDEYIDSAVHCANERDAKSSRKRPTCSERSDSGKETRSSDRHRHHHRGESKKYNESDSREAKRRVDPDIRGSHKRHLPESRLEPVERRGTYIEKEADHNFRHSRHGEKHPRDKNRDYRHQVVTKYKNECR